MCSVQVFLYIIIYAIQKVSSIMLNYVPEDNQTTITGLEWGKDWLLHPILN